MKKKRFTKLESKELNEEVPEEKDEVYLLNIKCIYEKKEHLDSIRNICVLKDGRICSCSGDDTIKIFSKLAHDLEITIKGHNSAINYVSILDEGNLLSSSDDKTLKIWKLSQKKYSLIQELVGHSGRVYKGIQLSKNRIGSCSADHKVKIWSSKFPYNCIHTLDEQPGHVRNIIELTNENYLVSSGNHADKTIYFWDNLNYKFTKFLRPVYCSSANSLYETNNNKLLVGGDGLITVINILTLQIETVVKFNLKFIGSINSFVYLKNNFILCGDRRGNFLLVKIVEFNSSVFKEKAHNMSVNSLQYVNNKIISCSTDGYLKIWSF